MYELCPDEVWTQMDMYVQIYANRWRAFMQHDLWEYIQASITITGELCSYDINHGGMGIWQHPECPLSMCPCTEKTSGLTHREMVMGVPWRRCWQTKQTINFTNTNSLNYLYLIDIEISINEASVVTHYIVNPMKYAYVWSCCGLL